MVRTIPTFFSVQRERGFTARTGAEKRSENLLRRSVQSVALDGQFPEACRLGTRRRTPLASMVADSARKRSYFVAVCIAIQPPSTGTCRQLENPARLASSETPAAPGYRRMDSGMYR